MSDYSTPDQVFSDLGDKVTHGLADCIEGARRDLAEYREMMPHAVRRHSARGLANWVHDAMWARAVEIFDDVSEVTLLESGPTRDIYVGHTYRLRMKRHSARGAIRAYPTQSTLRFLEQEDDLFSLIGIHTLNLCVGYEWDDQTRAMGSAVMSLRDGSFEESIWMIDLPVSNTGGATVTPMTPTPEGPSIPTIEVPSIDTQAEQAEGSDET